ncbi:MAG: hypothetical protein LBP23_03105 [Treponema sp.]|nr:hypothetical protein [Treponema sp.]
MTTDSGIPAAGTGAAADEEEFRFSTVGAAIMTIAVRAETAMRIAANNTALTASLRPAFLPLFFPEPGFLFFGAARNLGDFFTITITYHHYRQMEMSPSP